MRHRVSALLFWLAALALSLSIAQPARAQLVQLHPPPQLSAAGYQLILDFEVGGGERYYALRLARPSWPGFASGVTVGVGYDCGYNSPSVIRADWQCLEARDRLAAVSGITGSRARACAAELRDILIAWNIAEGVFQTVTLTRFYALTTRTFPGFDHLEPNCQAALLSLVFNRGSAMSGPRRAEMRDIRAAVQARDYRRIAAALRAMKRYWPARADSDRDLTDRREAEARLVETCL
jgi:hypothetical protein